VMVKWEELGSLLSLTRQVAGGPQLNGWEQLTVGAGIATFLTPLFYFMVLRWGPSQKTLAKRCGWLFFGSSALLLGCLVEMAVERVIGHLTKDGLRLDWGVLTRYPWLSGSSVVAALAAAIPTVLRFMPVLKDPKSRKWVMGVALVIGALMVPCLFTAVYVGLCLVGQEKSLPGVGLPGLTVLLLASVWFTLLAVVVLNINITGPHRMYRDGLTKTFVDQADELAAVKGLSVVNASHRAPYHLVNAAVNLPNTSAEGMRERQCDFFLFSKHWIGSPVCGYSPAKQWKANGQPMDLGTAMAISGAAFSAHMGLGSVPLLRGALAFLNVRLGFWIRQPHLPGKWHLPKWKHPGYFCLLREMLGLGMAEKYRWLNLSDGGHIENLAIYELLRRRCKFIIAVDGEADPTFTFQGLMTLVRHAQIDFGIRIAPDLSEIKPNATSGLSRSHFHLCRVHYPAVDGLPEATGLLLYLKLSVTGNESELIKRYRTNHPEFPHQTTLDQFFDEEQFEAYRQLGAHVTSGLLAPALIGTDSPYPISVLRWLGGLASNILEPELPLSRTYLPPSAPLTPSPAPAP
jgi:hypothetical protein